MSRTIYFDVDGVIARFTTGACKVHNRPTDETGAWATWDHQRTWGLSDPAFYAPMGREFWAGLPPWEDGFYLLREVLRVHDKDHIVFLTAPVQTDGCDAGKRDWFKKHLAPLGFDPWADLFVGGKKQALAGPEKLLIDDSQSNVKKFTEAGGAGWLVPRPWNDLRARCGPDGSFNYAAEFFDLYTFLRTVR